MKTRKFGNNDGCESFGMNWGAPGDPIGTEGLVPGSSFEDIDRPNGRMYQCWFIREWYIMATFKMHPQGCGSAKAPTPPQPPSGWHEGEEYEDYWNRPSQGPPVKGKWSGYKSDNKWCECIKVDPPYSHPPSNIPPRTTAGGQPTYDSGNVMDSWDPNIGPHGGGTRMMMKRTVRMLCKNCPVDPCKCTPQGKGKPTITKIPECSTEVDVEFMDPSQQTSAEQQSEGVYPGKPPCGMLGEGGSK